jgi:predicted dehydrogenase
MTDKPGVISFEQLAEVRRVQADTKRIYSILYSEHFETRSTVRAGELVRAGAIGKVINTVGLGPHRLNKPLRAGWFFERDKYGGIITDIASHQCEQFLFFTDALDAQVTAANIANCGNPGTPGLQDFGDFLMRTDDATGYVRVDWFTPDGLPTWGDGRLTIVGTEGTIELRKYVDIAGRPGTDHLFIADRTSTRHMDCSGEPLSYFRAFLHDIENRTQTAMPQAHVFAVSRLALDAQENAARIGLPPR